MTITAADIDRIRAVAEADKAGEDGKEWDETVTPDVVIALCDLALRVTPVKRDYDAESARDAREKFHKACNWSA